MKEINGNKRYELDDSHYYDIGFPLVASDRDIITCESVYNFDAPWNVDHTHVHGHLAWLKLKICLE